MRLNKQLLALIGDQINQNRNLSKLMDEAVSLVTANFVRQYYSTV